jgi:hypothetical protein
VEIRLRTYNIKLEKLPGTKLMSLKQMVKIKCQRIFKAFGIYQHVKVKQSNYRPGQAPRFPER